MLGVDAFFSQNGGSLTLTLNHQLHLKPSSFTWNHCRLFVWFSCCFQKLMWKAINGDKPIMHNDKIVILMWIIQNDEYNTIWSLKRCLFYSSKKKSAKYAIYTQSVCFFFFVLIVLLGKQWANNGNWTISLHFLLHPVAAPCWGQGVPQINK